MRKYEIRCHCYSTDLSYVVVGAFVPDGEKYKVVCLIDEEVEKILLEEDTDAELMKVIVEGIEESMRGYDEEDLEKERRYWIGSIRIEPVKE